MPIIFFVTFLFLDVTELTPMHDCRMTNLKWSVQDEDVFQLTGPVAHVPGLIYGKNACDGRKLTAVGEGMTKLDVEYRGLNGLVMRAFLTLVAYRPIAVSCISSFSINYLRI